MFFKQIAALLAFLFALLGLLFSVDIEEAISVGNIEAVQVLLQSQPELLEQNFGRDFTPLNWAAAQGQKEIFEYLVEIGANLNTKDMDGSGLLINAAAGGNLDIVRLLVEDKEFDINYADNNGFKPFQASCGSGNVDVMKFLVEKGADTLIRTNIGGVPLVNAIYSDSVAAVEYLFELGCEYDIPNQWNVYPVHYAAYLGNISAMQMLLDRNVDIFKETMRNETPFIWAVVGRRFAMADFLMENGEDINRVISGGVTPIHSAHKLQPESIDYLLDKGADLTIVDSTGNTVLHSAVWSRRDEIVQKLLEHGIDVNAKNNDGETALLNACWLDSLDVVKVLLEHGAIMEVGKCSGENGCVSNPKSPLFTCADRGKTDFVELLLNYQADVNLPEANFNRTPLHIAAIRGDVDVLNMLLAAGAEVNAKDIFERTPLYYAKIYHNFNTAEILTSNNAEYGKIHKKYKSDLLHKKIKHKEAELWFTGHSGWIFKTANNLLIIDYWPRGNEPDNACLENGWVNAEEIIDMNVTVLVSHEHGDHYDPVIWEWQETIPNIRYIFGMNVEGHSSYEVIEPHTSMVFDNLKITAIESNDSGVGFVITSDGVTLFHSGDHANETRDFSGTYWPEIEYVKENFSNIDIAMMPIRGCGLPDVESVRLGVVRTLRELQPKVFLPMHSTDEGSQYRAFNENLKHENITYTSLYYPLDKGDRFIYNKGKLK